jgi:hypothetical protein
MGQGWLDLSAGLFWRPSFPKATSAFDGPSPLQITRGIEPPWATMKPGGTESLKTIERKASATSAQRLNSIGAGAVFTHRFLAGRLRKSISFSACLK